MSRVRKLILHIGFPKTGSSAIQAWLARNAGHLAHDGIAYRNFHESAAQDAISSGNGQTLLDVLHAAVPPFAKTSPEPGDRIIPAYFEEFDTAFVSSEHLAEASKPRLEWLRDYCFGKGIAVSVLGYCRTVYDHCYSAYQQRVKRHGETGAFRDYAATYNNPQRGYLWSWHSAFGSALTIRNYDAVKKDLIADFVCQAGIDHLGLKTEQGQVNRSLTSGELELMRRLNAFHKGTLSRHLSDAVIYALPSRKSDHPFDPWVAKDLERRFGADVRSLNKVFFPNGPDPLAVSKSTESRPENAPAPQATISLDPAVEIVLEELGRRAADATEQERRLRHRLAIALTRVAMASGKWDIAEKHLRRALQIDPDDLDANRLLATVQRKRGDYEVAPIMSVRMENNSMDERDDGASEARRETRRPAHAEGRAAASSASGGQDVPGLAARKEARDRLAYIRIRMQELAEERERLMAERAAILAEINESRPDKSPVISVAADQ